MNNENDGIYLKWLKYQIKNNRDYKIEFWKLFGMFITNGQKLQRHKALDEKIDFFIKNVCFVYIFFVFFSCKQRYCSCSFFDVFSTFIINLLTINMFEAQRYNKIRFLYK